jgi:hypothetical protein
MRLLIAGKPVKSKGSWYVPNPIPSVLSLNNASGNDKAEAHFGCAQGLSSRAFATGCAFNREFSFFPTSVY